MTDARKESLKRSLVTLREKSTLYQLWIPKPLYNDLMAFAKSNGVALADVLRMGGKRYMEHNDTSDIVR